MNELKLLIILVVVGAAAVSPEPKGTVSGFVRDAQSGEVIPFADVYLEDVNIGTTSDRNGYYVLGSVPAGDHTLAVSIVGYQPLEKPVLIQPGAAVKWNARLQVAVQPVRGVTVTAERERFKKEVDIGVHQLKLKDLTIAPGFIEQDLFRSLTVLPGVVTVSNFSSALYIRGGSSDQNLVLLDGVTVYNPYHLGGLFSTFNLDALKNAELRAGAFPAEYGEAVSSVLDVEMKDGNSEHFEGKWDVSPLSAKIEVEGPIPNGSFLLAGRRTYIDAFTYTLDKAFGTQGNLYFPYYFYDLQGKVNFAFSDKNRLTLSGFTGDDVFHLDRQSENLDFEWGNYTVDLKWRYLITPKIFSTLLLTKSQYHVALTDKNTAAGGYDSDLKSGIGDMSVKEDITFFPNSNHTVKIGAEGKLLDVYDSFEQDTTTLLNYHQNPGYGAAYLSDKWQMTPKLLWDLGVRGEYFTGGSSFRVAPRIGIKYLINENLALKAGYGHFYQYLSIPYPRNEMMLELPVSMFEQWLPADSEFKPVHAVHYTLGVEKWFSSDLDASVEGYYKTMDNLLESETPFSFLGNFSQTESLAFKAGTGWATGAEFLLKWKNSWIGYTYAVTKRTFDSTTFYPIFDSRHSINIAWSVPVGKTWNFGLQWTFHSGFPYTGPVGRVQTVVIGADGKPEYRWVVIDGERGGFRYPAYHQLDVSVEKEFKLFRRPFTAYLQVINVYARKNVLWYTYNYTTEPPQAVPYSILPIPIPSIGIRGSF